MTSNGISGMATRGIGSVPYDHVCRVAIVSPPTMNATASQNIKATYH
jgi:hypothetical protein